MFGSHAGGTSGGVHGIGTFGIVGRFGVAGTCGVGGACTAGGVTGTPPPTPGACGAAGGGGGTGSRPPTPGACGAAGAGSFGAAGSFGVGSGSAGAGGAFGGVGSLRRVETFFAVSEFGSSNFVTSGIVIPGWLGPRYEPHSVASDGSFLSASTSA